MVLDAQKQPGWSSTPVIELNGTSAGTTAHGLSVTGGTSTVRGFVINRFTGTGYAGISLSGAVGNVVQGNYLGTNAAGTAASANYQGLLITTSNDTIGGSTATQRNVISGNTLRGILVDNTGLGAASNVIRGNYIGLNAAGTAALANSIGIYLSASPNNVIGGTAAGEGNTLSGNTNYGIYLVFGGTTGTQIQGNTVGLNAARSAAVPNGSSGIELCCSASAVMSTTIGGTTAAAANVISGNTGRGVMLRTGSGTAILGNAIYGNGGVGIDLGNDNVTPNNGTVNSSLPNSDMDFPVFTSVVLNGTTLTVTGYVGSAPSQATFANARVEIFKSDHRREQQRRRANVSGLTHRRCERQHQRRADRRDRARPGRQDHRHRHGREQQHVGVRGERVGGGGDHAGDGHRSRQHECGPGWCGDDGRRVHVPDGERARRPSRR